MIHTPVRSVLLAATTAMALLVLASPAPATAQEGTASEDAAPTPDAAEMTNRYVRAERLLGWNAGDRVLGVPGTPTFLDGSGRFWYRVRTADGNAWPLVDAGANARRPLFDPARLAAAMSEARDTAYAPVDLELDDLEVLEGAGTVRFTHGGVIFRCDVAAYRCAEVDEDSLVPDHHVPSPDGRWEAFVHDYDLWIRPAGGGDSTRLTTDGEEYFRYGEDSPSPGQLRRGTRSTPVLEWSPDSRRIAVQRTDERNVELMPIYSSTSQRPEHWLYKYSLPGDTAVTRFDIHVMDVESRSNVRVDLPPQPIPMSGFTGYASEGDWATVKWTEGGERLYATHHVRGRKRVQLQEIDPATGRPGPVLAKDTAATYVELNLTRRGAPNWFVVNGGDEVVWFSERDGWAHLYLYDGAGTVKNRITSGPWTVGDVLHVDEDARTLWFTARGREEGRNLYHAHLYRVGFDGSGLQLLTPEAADHDITFSPDGRFFVDRFSTPTDPGATVLRAASDGRVIRELERGDLSLLEETGWTPPEVVTVKARDGVTPLHGLVHIPSTLDEDGSYPVVVNIYPGPQIGSVRTWGFAADRQGAQALAELGFVVVQVDAMGTPYRHKAFHDAWYGNMGDNGIPDQIAAVKELAASRPYMDLDRVGIYGHSGGGFSSTGALLRYPDFFKVAVSGAGNHDNRSYGHYWAEQYQGLLVRDTVRAEDNYLNQVNRLHAENLEGKLLLMHGDMDDNVHPAMTIQLVDALIDANKSFDLIIAPDRAHGLNEPYFVRRRWDYFVEHLLGAEPPRDYLIGEPSR